MYTHTYLLTDSRNMAVFFSTSIKNDPTYIFLSRSGEKKNIRSYYIHIAFVRCFLWYFLLERIREFDLLQRFFILDFPIYRQSCLSWIKFSLTVNFKNTFPKGDYFHYGLFFCGRMIFALKVWFFKNVSRTLLCITQTWIFIRIKCQTIN